MIKTIIADPPWNQTGGGKIKRGADRHYKLMKTDECIITVADMLDSVEYENQLAENLHFYLWVTNNQVPDGLELFNKLGFTYKTNVCWVKDRFGIGYYFRGQHELMLFGVRGNGARVKTGDNGIPSVIHAKRRKHSQKPAEFYDLVERRSEGDYLYLFSRQAPRDGWHMIGDEVGKMDEERLLF